MLTNQKGKNIMQNSDVAHSFFYHSGSFYRRSMTVSYENNKYFSYSTCIGKITTTKDGQGIFLISRNKFSTTTAKHIGELRAASPYYNYLELPQETGHSDFYPESVLRRLYSDLEYYSNQKMTLKANREGFTEAFYTLKELCNIDGFDVDMSKLEEYQPLYNTITNPEELAKYKAKQAALEKKKAEELKEQLKNLLSKYDFATLAKMAYTSGYFEEKAALKKYLNPKNELSFIWYDGELVRTSQGIKVNRKEVEALLKLWNKGKLKKGMTISYYTIIEIKPDFVKVGCHKIPSENIKALFNQMNQQKEQAA